MGGLIAASSGSLCWGIWPGVGWSLGYVHTLVHLTRACALVGEIEIRNRYVQALRATDIVIPSPGDWTCSCQRQYNRQSHSDEP